MHNFLHFLLALVIAICVIIGILIIILIIKKFGFLPIFGIGTLALVIAGMNYCSTHNEIPEKTVKTASRTITSERRRYPLFKEGDSVFRWDGITTCKVVVTPGKPMAITPSNGTLTTAQWIQTGTFGVTMWMYPDDISYIDRVFGDGTSVPAGEVVSPLKGKDPSQWFYRREGSASMTLRKRE